MSTNTKHTIDLITLRASRYLQAQGRHGTTREEARELVDDLLGAIDWADLYFEDVVPAMIQAMLHAEHAHAVENEDPEVADRIIAGHCRKLSDRINERWICRCGADEHDDHEPANENRSDDDELDARWRTAGHGLRMHDPDKFEAMLEAMEIVGEVAK
jgi:hypothetical protein